MHSNTYKRILCGGMAVLMFAMTGCTAIDRFKEFVGVGQPAPTPTRLPMHKSPPHQASSSQSQLVHLHSLLCMFWSLGSCLVWRG